MKSNVFARHIAALTLPTLLVACGGGGSDDSTTTTGTSPTTPALAISGNAATGAAIAGGTVTAKCAAGTATPATTSTTGSYSVSVTSGVLPCVLQVTSADGAMSLYSIASGTSTTIATANLTPLTQLVVASLTGTNPATYFGSFDSSAAAAVTSTALSTAQAAVVTTLAGAGIDISTIGDLLTGTLTPATSSTTGNAYDQALDALATTLATSVDSSGATLTLATLTSTIAAASPTVTTPTTPTTTSGTPSLPADLLLKAAASNCSALRSGTYRVVNPASGSTLADQYGKIVINAATLAVTYTDGTPGVWATHATEACHFTDDATKTDIVVSQAGVIVVRHTEDGGSTYHFGIGFPEQTHTLAELAGTWNSTGLERNAANTAYTGIASTIVVDAAGVTSSALWCQNDTTWSVTGSDCKTVTTGLTTLAVDSAGGFDNVDAGTTNGRSFVYRAGGGELMMVSIDNDGSFEVRTKQRTNELPAVGRVNTGWDLRFTNQLMATPSITESTNTVTAVDTSSYTRLAKTVNGTDEHYETVLVNSPRDGYNFRAAATVTGTDGTTSVNVVEWTNLALRGMGLNALLRPASKQFMFSVQQPS